MVVEVGDNDLVAQFEKETKIWQSYSIDNSDFPRWISSFLYFFLFLLYPLLFLDLIFPCILFQPFKINSIFSLDIFFYLLLSFFNIFEDIPAKQFINILSIY